MADATTIPAESRLAGDNLFHNLYQQYDNLVGTDIPALRARTQGAPLPGMRIGDGAAGHIVTRGGIVTDSDISSMIQRAYYRSQAAVGIANGTTAGKLKSTGDIRYWIAATTGYYKAATDDCWDLSALGTTDGTHYKAVSLYLDSAGTATIAATTAQTSAALALAALEAIPSTKSRIGVFVMNPNGNFANALSSQGTIYDPYVPALSVVGRPAWAIGGTIYTAAAALDWDLSAETDTIANQARGYRLLVNSAGTTSFVATADVTNSNATTRKNAVLALLAALSYDSTLSVVGEIIVGPSTDMSADAILAKTGAFSYDGFANPMYLTAAQVTWG